MCAGLSQEWISYLNYQSEDSLVKAVRFGRYLTDIVSAKSVLTDIGSAIFGFHRYRYTDIIGKLWVCRYRLPMWSRVADIGIGYSPKLEQES
jgi:hypothetical protein